MTQKINYEQKNILVTGGAGFIGSHLCKELVKKNFVICIDDLSEGSERNIDHLLGIPNFKFIKHNLNEPINLEERSELENVDMRFKGIQEIYHLAAMTSPKKFEKIKLEIFNTNIKATQNALELAVKYNSKFLLASSSVIYGKRPDDNTFFQEDYFGYVNPVGGRCCYDEGKRASESITAIYKEKYGVDARIARIFRTYGTNMKIRDGHMLPDFVISALEGKNLVIHGNENFSTSLCYVNDIISGIIKLTELEFEEDIGPVNLGSDQNYKICDVANKIIQITREFEPLSKNSNVTYASPLEFMTPLGLPSIAKAKEQLGWLPIVTLNKGLTNMIKYIMASKNILDLGNMDRFDEALEENEPLV